MANHTLEEIVAVEKEIQARLAEEQRRAAEWLEGVGAAIARDTEAELAEARGQCSQLIESAAGDADAGVDAVVRRAELYAAQLHSLAHERLRERVATHLGQLLPGKLS